MNEGLPHFKGASELGTTDLERSKLPQKHDYKLEPNENLSARLH